MRSYLEERAGNGVGWQGSTKGSLKVYGHEFTAGQVSLLFSSFIHCMGVGSE